MFKKALIASTFSFAFAASLLAANEAHADEPAAPVAPSASLEAKPADVAANTGEGASSFKSITLSANPLSLALGRYGANLEVLPAVHHAIVVNPFFAHNSVDNLGEPGSTTYSSVGGELGYHYYTGHKGANGFFIGPSLFVMSSSVSQQGVQNPTSSSIFVYGAALDLGGQHVFDNGFTIGAGAGLMYLASNVDSAQTSSTFKVSGVLPRVLFTLGYSF